MLARPPPGAHRAVNLDRGTSIGYNEARPGPVEVSVLPLCDRAAASAAPLSSAAGSLVRSDLSFRSLCYLCLPLPMSSLGRIHVFPRYLLEHFPVRSMFSASDSFRKFGRSSDQFLCSSILFCCSMRSADGCPVLVGTFEFLFRKHNR